MNRIDPTGHEDCAPEDDWCWQNRWYEAHGNCWSDRTQSWSKQCEPEFQDEGILKDVLGEEGGLAIVAKANPIKLLLMLAASTGSSGFANGIVNAIGGDPKPLQQQIAEMIRLALAAMNPGLSFIFYGPNSVDAVGVGFSGNIAFDGGTIQAGLEFIYNLRSGELTFFAYLGGSLGTSSIGVSANLSPYDIFVWNLRNNAAYVGPFVTLNGSISRGYGASVALFTGNTANPLDFWDSAYGFTIGPAVGAGLSLSTSYLNYCALATVGEGEPLQYCPKP